MTPGVIFTAGISKPPKPSPRNIPCVRRLPCVVARSPHDPPYPPPFRPCTGPRPRPPVDRRRTSLATGTINNLINANIVGDQSATGTNIPGGDQRRPLYYFVKFFVKTSLAFRGNVT